MNEWLRRDDAGIMAIEGTAGASAGYRWNLDPAQAGPFTALKLRLSGTPGARFYVNMLGARARQSVASGWRDTPDTEQEVVVPDPGRKPGDRRRVVRDDEGRHARREPDSPDRLEGGQEPLVIPPGMSTRGIKSARLDLRRAVAIDGRTPARTAVRVLADRNVFLIETDQEVSLEEIKSPDLPAAELGETGGVKWLHMKMPGDPDYPGMEYALAVAANGTRKAVSLVTSFDTKENVRDAAVRLARETAAADPAALDRAPRGGVVALLVGQRRGAR